MTPEIKQQIENAATELVDDLCQFDDYSNDRLDGIKEGFESGCREVLERPELYGLLQLDDEEKQLIVDTLNSACVHVRYYSDKDKDSLVALKSLISKINGGKQ